MLKVVRIVKCSGEDESSLGRDSALWKVVGTAGHMPHPHFAHRTLGLVRCQSYGRFEVVQGRRKSKGRLASGYFRGAQVHGR